MLGLGRAGLGYAACVAVATMAFVISVQLTTVANTVFIVSLAPVFAALWSRLFLGERLSRRMAWTIPLCLFGALVIASGSASVAGASLAGDLLALLAAASLAAAFTVARAARSISMVPAAGLGYVLSTLALAAFAMPGEMQGADWVWAVLLGVVFVPVATCLMALGPRYIPAPEVALLILLEAILAPLLIWVVLREDPGARALVGGAVVVSVLFVSNLIALRRQRPAARGPRRSRP
jgi:drug/metabolite transporter (DMT)-like permease